MNEAATLLILIYFLPSVVALLRSHPSFLGIVIFNAILGWTVLGWFFALIWAVHPFDVPSGRNKLF